jgi:Ni/Co efflux regulator RcnB
MRKLVLALAGVAALGLTVPLTAPAHAEDTVIIKKRGGHHDWDRSRRKVTVIKRDHRPADRVVVVKKHRPEKKVIVREN